MAGNGFIDKDEWIGLCEAKYKWGGPWKPIDGYKHTLCGNLSIKKKKGLLNKTDSNNKYHLISDGDGDLVFYVTPYSSFNSLLYKSLRPKGHSFKDSSLSCEVALKESGNTIQGYLKIETSVGKVNDDTGAHDFFNMVLSKKNISE